MESCTDVITKGRGRLAVPMYDLESEEAVAREGK